MNQNELTIIRTNIKGQLADKQIAPLAISGSPGMGKSTAVATLANELDMNLVEYSAPTLTIEFLSGLPNETTLTGFFKSQIVQLTDKLFGTAWSMPELITSVWNAAEVKPTILLIDDFHGMAPHLQSYFYQLLLGRRLGNYKLPENVAIILTMNNSESAGFNGINSAIRNRLSILPIEFNFDFWLDTYGHKLHYLVASFLRSKPHFCTEDETTGIVGYASARAWTAIAKEISLYPEEFLLKYSSKIAGMQVSSAAAQAFQTHVNYVAAIDFTQIVAKHKLADLSTKDPLDAIIYSYIPNFIHTLEDGIYLLDFMEHNKDESTFIGFVYGELYNKFTQAMKKENLSIGITFVIDKLLHQPMDFKKYPSIAKEKLEQAFEYQLKSGTHFNSLAKEYLF